MVPETTARIPAGVAGVTVPPGLQVLAAARRLNLAVVTDRVAPPEGGAAADAGRRVELLGAERGVQLAHVPAEPVPPVPGVWTAWILVVLPDAVRAHQRYRLLLAEAQSLKAFPDLGGVVEHGHVRVVEADAVRAPPGAGRDDGLQDVPAVALPPAPGHGDLGAVMPLDNPQCAEDGHVHDAHVPDLRIDTVTGCRTAKGNFFLASERRARVAAQLVASIHGEAVCRSGDAHDILVFRLQLQVPVFLFGTGPLAATITCGRTQRTVLPVSRVSGTMIEKPIRVSTLVDATVDAAVVALHGRAVLQQLPSTRGEDGETIPVARVVEDIADYVGHGPVGPGGRNTSPDATTIDEAPVREGHHIENVALDDGLDFLLGSAGHCGMPWRGLFPDRIALGTRASSRRVAGAIVIPVEDMPLAVRNLLTHALERLIRDRRRAAEHLTGPSTKRPASQTTLGGHAPELQLEPVHGHAGHGRCGRRHADREGVADRRTGDGPVGRVAVPLPHGPLPALLFAHARVSAVQVVASDLTGVPRLAAGAGEEERPLRPGPRNGWGPLWRPRHYFCLGLRI
mmetsp:Transcript_25426/g.70837  ORF Transcript_25426/g.70837 Transcript_25426/m.70837 type:complete len:568 (-) Transcript_25426:319-2022(-)